MQTFLSLPVLKTLSPSLTLRQIDELPVLVIDHPVCQAAITLQGAHLLCFKPTRAQSSLLWLSSNTPFKKDVPIRGGIPVCWPWFGKMGGDLQHAFARVSEWALKTHMEDSHKVSLTLELTDSEATREHWPHSFTALMHFTLDDTSCTLEIETQGNYSATAAFHTYFEVSDIAKTVLSGVGQHYKNMLANGAAETLSASEMQIGEETNFIFTDPPAISTINDGVRTIEVRHTHHKNIVVWNPWIEVSRKNEDMPDDGYKTMVCLETTCIDTPIISTAATPGKMGVTIRLI